MAQPTAALRNALRPMDTGNSYAGPARIGTAEATSPKAHARLVIRGLAIRRTEAPDQARSPVIASRRDHDHVHLSQRFDAAGLARGPAGRRPRPPSPDAIRVPASRDRGSRTEVLALRPRLPGDTPHREEDSLGCLVPTALNLYGAGAGRASATCIDPCGGRRRTVERHGPP